MQSVEDHGYILDIGIQGSSGFLSFKDAKKGGSDGSKLHIGQLLDTSIVKMSSNERICTVSVDPRGIQSSSVSLVDHVSRFLTMFQFTDHRSQQCHLRIARNTRSSIDYGDFTKRYQFTDTWLF